jgi:peptidoglycan/LPS O-acetylase OafA/YrhL
MHMGHDEYLKIRNFGALDGLRAVSVFLVFAAHFGGLQWEHRAAGLGVHIFFVLSGFLITTLMLRERDRSGGVSLTAFYIRRCARLLPLYFLVFALVFVHSWLLGGTDWQQMRAAAPYYLSFMGEYAPPGPLFVTWSLGVEWKYYLVWPVLCALFATTPRDALATALVCLAALLLVWVAIPSLWWIGPWHYFGLMAGSILAIVMHTPAGYARLRGLRTNAAAIGLALALVLMHAKAAAIIAAIGQQTMMGVYCLLVALLLPGLVAPTWLGRALARPWMRFIGQRSYGMYLIQVLCAHLLISAFGLPYGRLLLAVSFLAALAAADVLFRWFEKPINDRGHRWAKSFGKTPARAAAAMAADAQPARPPLP